VEGQASGNCLTWDPSAIAFEIVAAQLPDKPIVGVVTRLGHATISITLDTYSHAIPAMQEEEALIAGLVFAQS
jgi:hypothetical protein